MSKKKHPNLSQPLDVEHLATHGEVRLLCDCGDPIERLDQDQCDDCLWLDAPLTPEELAAVEAAATDEGEPF